MRWCLIVIAVKGRSICASVCPLSEQYVQVGYYCSGYYS